MDAFAQEWNLESALAILKHPTVDSDLWTEAVEWLLIYGPPEIRELLGEASGHATGKTFPELQPQSYGPDGSPCYDISDMARSLGISEEEARRQLAEKEARHGVRHGVDDKDTTTLQ